MIISALFVEIEKYNSQGNMYDVANLSLTTM